MPVYVFTIVSVVCQNDVFGWHVSVASVSMTSVHECDISPDLVEDFLNDQCSMKIGHENDDIAMGCTELSPNILMFV